MGWEWVTEDVVWAKLKTLRQGADIRVNSPLGQEGRLSHGCATNSNPDAPVSSACRAAPAGAGRFSRSVLAARLIHS